MERNTHSSEEMACMLTDDELDQVAGGGTQNVPGFDCPECGTFIPTTIHELLVTTCITCPACKAEFPVDRIKRP